ncbi:MAG TPA: cytochrome P450 [Gemmatimonadaceae bacterium]|nr:cytochrome P450 [Gemmatimonadaceae bacterium]
MNLLAPVANILRARRDLAGFLLGLQREQGDVARATVGNLRVHLLAHPDQVRDVLVTHQRAFMKGHVLQRAKILLGEGLLTSEGEFHLRQRRLVQPAFHRQRIAAYAQDMVDRAWITADRWRDGETVDMDHEMMQLTLAIVARTLFDADVDAEADEIGGALTEALHLFQTVFIPGMHLLDRLPLPHTRRFARARGRLDATIYRLIAERRSERARGKERGDLLSMMLSAQDAEGDGGSMTDEQLRDEAMTLFLAGHETTANALTWTWYLLSQHADVAARLHDEVDRILGQRRATADDLASLSYTRMVLSESMRLYPPAYAIGRRALEDYPVPGIVIPRGALVVVSPLVTQRDARWFPDPARFDPERWTPEAQAARPKFSYFPFGGGTRMCIGDQFAWTEGMLVLATLAQRWRAELAAGQRVAMRPMITLRTRYGMRMVLRERRQGSRGQGIEGSEGWRGSAVSSLPPPSDEQAAAGRLPFHPPIP